MKDENKSRLVCAGMGAAKSNINKAVCREGRLNIHFSVRDNFTQFGDNFDDETNLALIN